MGPTRVVSPMSPSPPPPPQMAMAAEWPSSSSAVVGELSLTAFAALLSSYRSAGGEGGAKTDTKAPSLCAFLAARDKNAASFWSALSSEVVATFPSFALKDADDGLSAELLKPSAPGHKSAKKVALKSLGGTMEATQLDVEMNDFPGTMLENLAGSFEALVNLHLSAASASASAGGNVSGGSWPRVRTGSVVTTFKVLSSSRSRSSSPGPAEEEKQPVDESIFDDEDASSLSDGEGSAASSSFDSSLAPTGPRSTTTVLPLILEVSINAAVDSGPSSKGRIVPLTFKAPGSITGTLSRSDVLPDKIEVSIDVEELLRRMTFQARCLAAIEGSRVRMTTAVAASKKDGAGEKQWSLAAAAATISPSVVEIIPHPSLADGTVTGTAKKKRKKKRERTDNGLGAIGRNDNGGGTAATDRRAWKREKTLLEDYGGTSVHPALWSAVPALTASQQVRVEYSQPAVLPFVAWALDFGRVGTMHAWTIVLLHTVECFLTDWGPETTSWHIRNAPISTDAHSLIDSLVIMCGMAACMLAFPHHYGGEGNSAAFWTAVAIVCMQPFSLAQSYSTKDYKARVRRNIDLRESAEGLALRRASKVCGAAEEWPAQPSCSGFDDKGDRGVEDGENESADQSTQMETVRWIHKARAHAAEWARQCSPTSVAGDELPSSTRLKRD